MISRIGNKSAFTLIEVLVASVILFAGLGAVLKAYSMAVVALDSASDMLNSSAWLRDKAAAFDLQVRAGEGVTSGGGQTRLAGQDYRWEVDAREQVITPDIKIQSATLRITRVPRGAPHFLQTEWAVFRDPATTPQSRP